ncbi:HTH-type transcriptional regulator GbpR [Pigmentiphaga humi]|uniref:HTH-type transcriptional regulator GbpR n=1 Tax=Pigmentiphaga humi TaxID=2478468 RepID=A0A3P4B593_9BURK|nr:LysR family transcriptional regulator [Pigmentiphaga humi]VCU71457.1 HTH-type transcriptional regulator GbpR [Pigmentiphaga humi]
MTGREPAANTRRVMHKATGVLPAHAAKLKVRHFLLLERLIEHGSLRGAARSLGLAQTAAGALLRELEHALGDTLFIRSRTGVIPTKSAMTLAARSGVAMEVLRVGLAEAARGALPTLRIGIVHHAMMLHGTAWLAAMRREAPDLQLHVHVAPAPELLRGISSGDLDCAIARFPPANMTAAIHEQCRVWPLQPDRWSVVARPGHEIFKARRSLPAASLLQYDWVLPHRDSQTSQVFRSACMAAGISPPQPALVVDGVQYCVSIAAATDLLTICPDSMLGRPLSVKLKPIRTDLAIDASPLAVICRIESQRLQSVRMLLELVLSGPAAATGEVS